MSIAGTAAHLASREEDAIAFFARAEAAAETEAERRDASWGELRCRIDLEDPGADAALARLSEGTPLGQPRNLSAQPPTFFTSRHAEGALILSRRTSPTTSCNPSTTHSSSHRSSADTRHGSWSIRPLRERPQGECGSAACRGEVPGGISRFRTRCAPRRSHVRDFGSGAELRRRFIALCAVCSTRACTRSFSALRSIRLHLKGKDARQRRSASQLPAAGAQLRDRWPSTCAQGLLRSHAWIALTML